MKSQAFVPILIALATAVVVAIGLTFLGPRWMQSDARIVATYDAAALAILISYWSVALRTDASGSKRRAGVPDPGRNAVFALILIAVAFGFVAAFGVLGHGPHDSVPAHAAIVYTMGFGAVVLGWLLIHTVFFFHYARIYYADLDRNHKSDGGLVFPGGTQPNDLDFAYFSFVIGMTFQVSDVQITSPTIRRVALVHSLISFAYNTAILALVVNVVSSLLR